MIFVGPVLLYVRYVEKVRAARFLRLVAAAAFVAWCLLLDRVVGDGSVGGAAFAVVLFTILSPTALIEEVYVRGFLSNELWRATGSRKANAATSALFAQIHYPGWFTLGRFATPPRRAERPGGRGAAAGRRPV